MDGSKGFLDERHDHRLVLVAAQFEIEVDRLAAVHGEIFLLEACVRVVGKVLLRRLSAAQYARHCTRLVGHAHPMLELQMFQHVRDDLLVEIIAAELVVTVAGDHLHHAALDPDYRDIEGTAAQIVDQDALALMLRGLVDEGGRGRLVDDPHHLQPSDLTGLARRLPLRV